jgi:hypothetical protein
VVTPSRTGGPSPEFAPLAVKPPLELGRVVGVERLEQVAGVQIERPRRVAAAERRIKLHHAQPSAPGASPTSSAPVVANAATPRAPRRNVSAWLSAPHECSALASGQKKATRRPRQVP